MPNDIIHSVNVIKARRAFKHIEKAKALEFSELVQRAYKSHPSKKQIEELRNWLDEYPALWRLTFDMGQVIETNIIKRILPQQPAQLAIATNVEEIRNDLGYEEATAMEMMLIDNIVLSWLRCQWAEYLLMALMGQGEIRHSSFEFWDRRLSAAQGRYLRACETLAKIRKLSLKNPTLQVNIATKSGQQVNVAGDVIRNNQST